ncbi:hypothetical protein BJ165DRAFT_1532137 [Panaeolus papilionaceus]|nr:hypothetical protein BJ165DRAFT_1532137 [Panaeolus papilionaceus]
MPSVFDQAIVAKRDPSAPIRVFDGLVAAYMQYEGEHILCTSPNQHHVPLPILHEDNVRLRANLRYGTADHMLWPQFVTPNTSHFSTMLRKPVDPSHALAAIWWDPTPADFLPSYGGIISGIGTKRVDLYLESSPKPSSNATKQINLRRYHMENSWIRLSSLKVSYVETVFTITEFQRYCLEIIGFIDFMQKYQPHLDGLQRFSNVANEIMGAFTWDSCAAQELFNASMPVWFLRRWKGDVFPFENNILRIVDFMPPDPSILKDHNIITLPTLFRGRMWDAGCYNAIWNSPSSSTQQPHSSSSSTPGSLRPYPTPHSHTVGPRQNMQPQRNLRNKFLPLSYPAAPYPIEAWKEALASVDQSPANIVNHDTLRTTAGHYIILDPGVILGPETDEKKARFLTTWLLCRNKWFRQMDDDTLALSNQEWRDLLGLDLRQTQEDGVPDSRFRNPLVALSSTPSQPPKPLPSSLPIRPARSSSGSRTSRKYTAQDHCQKILDLFKDNSVFADTVQVLHFAPSPSWNGMELIPDALPPQSVICKILWELYEINFVYELEALDHHACADPNLITPVAWYERQRLVIKCYDSVLRYKRPDIPARNLGLAADDIAHHLPFIISLARVMTFWKGNPPLSFMKFCESCRPEMLGRELAMELERDVARFYCQMFYNYFGRAAQIPHRLYMVQ